MRIIVIFNDSRRGVWSRCRIRKVVCVRRETCAPETSPRVFPWSCYDASTRGIKDVQEVARDLCCAVGVAQFAEADEVVGEGREDVAGLGPRGNRRYGEAASGVRMNLLAGGSADCCGRSSAGDVREGRVVTEVVVRGS